MIVFGKNKFSKDEDIKWDPYKVVNGHFMIVGGSGTGKTYNIRKILRELMGNNADIDVHVLDVHGDIDIGDDVTSTVTFSETSDFGLQPLKISDDKEFGGVRKKVRTIISMINNTTRKLGTKQESVMIALLNDLYRAAGFYQEDSRTWSLSHDPRKNPKYKKIFPSMVDLKMFAKFKLEQIFLGSSSRAVHRLESLNKSIKSLESTTRKMSKSQHDEEETAKLSEKLDKLKGDAKTLYNEYIDSITTGRELEEIMKYDSMEVIKSVYERIDGMLSTGIFKSTKPNFDTSKKVKRYVIKSLNSDEQKMFVDILLEDLFMEAKERGEQKGVKTFIVIDEAHKFINDDDGHVINIIMREARKFGVGLILASQSFGHFSEDIIANAATKIVLGIDEMYHEISAKKLRVEAKRFTYITPQKTAMIQVKNKGDMNNRFLDVLF